MKLLTTVVCGLTLAAVAAPTASLAPIAIGSEAFDASFGHIQGACCSEDAIYLSQMKCLYKFDWSGKLLKKKSVISHTGDICFWQGEIYTAVAVYGGTNRGKGMIQVFDQELNLVRETLLDRSTDGITILDGVLYIGMGSNHVPSREAHRENWAGRFDPKTLKPLGERQIIDFGYVTHYGIQDISNDGKHILCAFYSAKKGQPNFVAFDKDWKVVRADCTYYASNGFDRLPARFGGDQPRFFRVKTHRAPTDKANPKARRPLSVTIDFFEWKDGKPVDITQRK
ncbi:MAG: hypothetical protein IJI36_01925 [Kiritimatiellae bacterium]|nr:hypothetical protein [Kiritimatiellia bacterium]